MKKLTKEEKETFITRPMQKQSYVRTLLMNMAAGDIILLEESDWKSKTTTPLLLIWRIEKKTGRGYKCEKVINPGKGWIITRMK